MPTRSRLASVSTNNDAAADGIAGGLAAGAIEIAALGGRAYGVQCALGMQHVLVDKQAVQSILFLGLARGGQQFCPQRCRFGVAGLASQPSMPCSAAAKPAAASAWWRCA